ncbi:MAG: DNA photolyase [Bacillota bacterium]|nr:DNA photolyase [Bacillota bacterium]
MPAFSKNSLPEHRFNVIYVEAAAFSYELTRQVIGRLPSCPVITVRHYKDVFNRANQDSGWQKAHQSLILAVKSSPFLYAGPRICQNFGFDRFFYANFMLNCPFDCAYCYLQGMYPSAHVVAFVNPDDILDAIDTVSQNEPAYLALSHDADLMSFHGIIPYLDLLADRLDGRRHLMAEVRTKSANRAYYLSHEPTRQLVFAFSLAPEAVIRSYEQKTPSLEHRLAAIETALDRGFSVRLCFDPIIIDPATDNCYPAFFRTIFNRIDPDRILDVSYGFFRMPETFYHRIARRRPDLILYHRDFEQIDTVMTYSEKDRQTVTGNHLAVIGRYVDPARIYLV